jgi:hypothetical protein
MPCRFVFLSLLAGLDRARPGHPCLLHEALKDVDARDKRGHDG